MAVMLSAAPGRSSASSVRSSRPVGRDAEADADAGDQRDRGVDDQQPLPPHVGQRGAAEQRAEDEAGHADDDHHRHGAHAQRLVVEEPEDQRVGDRRHRRGGDAERGAQGDELACRGDGDDAQAQQAEHREPDQQHASAPEPVGHRSGGEQQAAERQRVGAGDPLQRGRAAAEVAADRGQRDRQQRVVDHLDEEGQAEGGQRDPRRAQGRVGARRGARYRSRGDRMLGRMWCRGHGHSIGRAAHITGTRHSHGAHNRPRPRAIPSVSTLACRRCGGGRVRSSARAARACAWRSFGRLGSRSRTSAPGQDRRCTRALRRGGLRMCQPQLPWLRLAAAIPAGCARADRTAR